jgi:signal transduction histidine kinase
MMTDLAADTTYFAPAGRDPAEVLEHMRTVLLNVPLLQSTIDAMSDVVLILNGHRQIVSVNQALLTMLDCTAERVLGKRPGELLGCQNSSTGPDGCGTGEGCQACGAVNAILDSQKTNGTVTRECRVCLTEPVGGALDLSVSATGVDIDGERFVICVLKDISDQKRLAVLARMFFHDVMNTAGSIRGFAELLREHAVKDSPEDEELSLLTQLADQLVEEIQAQRDLTYAESGDLEPEFAPVDTLAILERLRATCARHAVARNRCIELSGVWKGSLITDERLLGRVLANMIKNALEATRPGGKISVGCWEHGPDVVFTVHNEGVMPQKVQLQVFQRSFSTKAKLGRGIGTHSMKLFGERYLGGRVAFTSREPEGTVFSLRIPKVALGAPP